MRGVSKGRWLTGSLLGLLFFAAIASAQTIADLGFTTKVGAAFTAQYVRKFGAPVTERFTRWATFAKEQQAASFSRKLESAKGRESETLQVINDEINRQIKWFEDKVHWGVDDYWATPAESISSAGGDCEDFSIAKYYLLKELGVPIGRLRITYVRALKLGGQAHMILAYYSRPDAEPLIMDNIDAQVRPASQRDDLDPVYTFNDDEVQMVKGGQRAKPSQIRAWLTLQEHLVAESRT